jgi:hypothetical protein
VIEPGRNSRRSMLIEARIDIVDAARLPVSPHRRCWTTADRRANCVVVATYTSPCGLMRLP